MPAPRLATVTAVFGGLNRLLGATVVAGAACTVMLAGPSPALACSGGVSAVNVYKECLPSGGGGGGSKSSGGGSGHTSSGPSGGSEASTPTVSRRAAKAIRHAGKDSRALAYVESTGPSRLLHASPSSDSGPNAAATPTAVGSAFDLGSGPTALLIALAGTAILLLGLSGVRGFRHRHRA